MILKKLNQKNIEEDPHTTLIISHTIYPLNSQYSTVLPEF
jgi:hypothetical protein